MSDKVCPICLVRVSQWMIAGGKTTSINNMTLHNACLQDFYLKRGKEWSINEITKELGG